MKKIVLDKYMIFIKYILVSGISFVIDLLFFKFFIAIFNNIDIKILLATICARIISSFINYILNRNAVFKFKEKESKFDFKSLYKYYGLVVIQMLVSALLVTNIYNILKIDEWIIKFGVDVVIFVINFFIQKLFIFKKGEK